MTISPVDVNLPQTLRMKAVEFRRLARDAREPRTLLDLQHLADDYEQQANDLDCCGAGGAFVMLGGTRLFILEL
jgi:hypothetical protein